MTNILSDTARDAFGRLRISQPFSLFDSKQLDDNQPIFWDDQEILGGSGTSSAFDQNRASTTLAVSALQAGRRVRRTYQRFNYQSGKSQQVVMTFVLPQYETGVTRKIGYKDDNNGVYIKQTPTGLSFCVLSNVSGTPTENEIPFDQWELFDHDDLSDNIEPGRTMIFAFDLQWLGVGNVRIGFEGKTGEYKYYHVFKHAGNTTSVYMSTPNLPLSFEIENDGTGGASDLECICGSVSSEGGQELTGSSFSASTGGGNVVQANSTANIYAVVGLRLQALKPNKITRMRRLSLLAFTNDDFEWMLILNPTIAGAFTYNAVDPSSSLEWANGGINSNTVTGGIVLDRGWITGNTDRTTFIDTVRWLGQSIDGTMDQMVLCVQPRTTNLDVVGSITWVEL